MYIGIIGHMGHGKTTRVGAYLELHGFKRFHPATTLRKMLVPFLEDLGYSPNEIPRMLEGDLKRVPLLDLPGVTPTTLQQDLGTAWGRLCVNPEIWNIILFKRISAHMREAAFSQRNLFNDSIRFPNEVEAVLRQNGILIRVTRPGFPTDLTHESEKHIPSLPYHYEVINKSDAPSSFVDSQLQEILRQLRHGMSLPPLRYPGTPQPSAVEFI